MRAGRGVVDRPPTASTDIHATTSPFSKEDMKDVVIAYEPVWAIGTGLVCDANAANQVHKFIRTVLAKMYDEEVAQSTRIQYGGSVTPESVDGLMAQSDIDGCLVGGASLFADKFARIVSFQPE